MVLCFAIIIIHGTIRNRSSSCMQTYRRFVNKKKKKKLKLAKKSPNGISVSPNSGTNIFFKFYTVFFAGKKLRDICWDLLPNHHYILAREIGWDLTRSPLPLWKPNVINGCPPTRPVKIRSVDRFVRSKSNTNFFFLKQLLNTTCSGVRKSKRKIKIHIHVRSLPGIVYFRKYNRSDTTGVLH